MYLAQIPIPIYMQTHTHVLYRSVASVFYLHVHMTLINVDNPLHTPPKIMDPNCENCLYSNTLRAEYLKSVWHTKLGFLKTAEVGQKDQRKEKKK